MRRVGGERSTGGGVKASPAATVPHKFERELMEQLCTVCGNGESHPLHDRHRGKRIEDESEQGGTS